MKTMILTLTMLALSIAPAAQAGPTTIEVGATQQDCEGVVPFAKCITCSLEWHDWMANPPAMCYPRCDPDICWGPDLEKP